MADVRMRGVRKSFGAVEIIKGVDLDIEKGEFVVFVGPSGCGKSTLLRMISGLEDITSGELHIGNQLMNDVDPSKRGVAMVFQSYALYPHMTVRENMAFALRFAGMPRNEIKTKVDGASKILGLEALMDRKPKALSGGQRQRVAIGRAIVRDPRVFLFDEPLSNLDAALRVHMRIEIARLHRELGTTIVYVTHDQVEAMTLADKIVVLRAGLVEQIGAPLELYDNPANTFVAGFIGSPRMNFLEGRAKGGEGKLVKIEVPGLGGQIITIPIEGEAEAVAGTQVSIGIRPEHFCDNGTACLELNIEMLEHLGGETFAYAKAESGMMVVIKTNRGRELDAGRKFNACFNPSSALLFDAAGKRIY